MMDERRSLRHFVATLAYRGTNILQDMSPTTATFRPHQDVRTPVEILNHVNGVLTYAHSFFVEYDSTRPELADWETEVARFSEILKRLDDSLSAGDSLSGVGEMQLLQGPLADAMLHLGQIGIFRRMAGSPVAPENYVFAGIQIGMLRRPS